MDDVYLPNYLHNAMVCIILFTQGKYLYFLFKKGLYIWGEKIKSDVVTNETSLALLVAHLETESFWSTTQPPVVLFALIPKEHLYILRYFHICGACLSWVFVANLYCSPGNSNLVLLLYRGVKLYVDRIGVYR